MSENENYAPKKPTTAENVILTIKVLGGAALLMAAIWGIERML